jgi:hypothetical protein
MVDAFDAPFYPSAELAIKSLVEHEDVYFKFSDDSVIVYVRGGDEEKAARSFAVEVRKNG